MTAVAARRKGLHMVAKDAMLTLLVGVTAAAAIGTGWLIHGRLHVPDGGTSAAPHRAADRLASAGELLVMAAVTAVVWVPVIWRTMRSRKAVA